MTENQMEQLIKRRQAVSDFYAARARDVEMLSDKVNTLTEERDAWKQAHDEQVAKLIEIANGRDALAANHKDCVRCLGEALQDRTDLAIAAKLALEAITELRYSNSTHAADTISDKAITALRQAGVQ